MILNICFGSNRFITRDELRKAMHQYVMGEEAIVNEVINDVGADQVSHSKNN